MSEPVNLPIGGRRGNSEPLPPPSLRRPIRLPQRPSSLDRAADDGLVAFPPSQATSERRHRPDFSEVHLPMRGRTAVATTTHNISELKSQKAAPNLYVETPTLQNKRNEERAAAVASQPQLQQQQQNKLLQQQHHSSNNNTVVTTQQPLPARTRQHQLEKLVAHGDPASTTAAYAHDNSEQIICQQCGRCRCAACRQPRELPSSWLCNGSCHCSGSNIVEVASCMTLVRALFYHGCKDWEGDTDTPSETQPCACCDAPHCCARWSCILCLSPFVPCLCLYWPLRCMLSTTQRCYTACDRRACTCRLQPMGKRLLIDSESSST